MALKLFGSPAIPELMLILSIHVLLGRRTSQGIQMITRKALELKVIEVVQDTLALTTPPELKHSFRDDLDADSIDIVTLLVTLEDELETPFDQGKLEGKDTLISVVDFIEQALSEDTSQVKAMV